MSANTLSAFKVATVRGAKSKVKVFACQTSVMWMSYYSQYTQAETAVWQGGQWQPWQAAIRVANSGKVAGVGCSHSVAHWPGAAATPAASYFCLHNVSTKKTPQK